jgi:drug/metabolite transporter (DMT)-like permease
LRRVNWHLAFPFLSSLLYVGGVLLIKRASDLRAGVWRTAFVSNTMAALVFLALLPFEGRVLWDRLWEPALVALLFAGGQVLTFLALERGDVSVVTPAMGSKTIMVAWFSTLLLGERLPWQLWLSAVLSFLAIALLSRAGRAGPRTGLARMLVLSLLAAVCYALFDVLVQKWAPAWGAPRFLPVMFCFCALFSTAFVPLFRQPLRAIPKAAWPWLLGGSLLVALQAMSLVTALAVFGDATAMNVIYSGRGLWSVAAVWLVGHWFHNQEQRLESRVLAWRLTGAAIMLAAIFTTLTK